MNNNKLPDGLHVVHHYYCDNGIHKDKWFVAISGYVTRQQIDELLKA